MPKGKYKKWIYDNSIPIPSATAWRLTRQLQSSKKLERPQVERIDIVADLNVRTFFVKRKYLIDLYTLIILIFIFKRLQ